MGFVSVWVCAGGGAAGWGGLDARAHPTPPHPTPPHPTHPPRPPTHPPRPPTHPTTLTCHLSFFSSMPRAKSSVSVHSGNQPA